MKIAVISDIHGNMEALEAVMDDIKKQDCEKIFVLGDYAMAGPEPRKVIDWFFNRQFDNKIKMIKSIENNYIDIPEFKLLFRKSGTEDLYRLYISYKDVDVLNKLIEDINNE